MAFIKQETAQFLFRKIFGALRVCHGRDYTAPEALFFRAGNGVMHQSQMLL
jgi:hypothetical protein